MGKDSCGFHYILLFLLGFESLFKIQNIFWCVCCSLCMWEGVCLCKGESKTWITWCHPPFSKFSLFWVPCVYPYNEFFKYIYTFLSWIYDILQFFARDLMPAGLYHQVAQLRRTTSVLLDRKVNNENCLRSVLYY